MQRLVAGIARLGPLDWQAHEHAAAPLGALRIVNSRITGHPPVPAQILRFDDQA